MKKNLLFVIYMTVCMFAASCVKDGLSLEQNGDDVPVSFNIGVETALGTRAISDASGIDQLTYAVFNEAGAKVQGSTIVVNEFPQSVGVTLPKGQKFKIAFWAQDADCTAYTLSYPEGKGMSVAVSYDDALNNDETRDAFFAAVDFTVAGSSPIDVTLKRPFAQVNVGITAADYQAAYNKRITIARSTMTITNLATSLDILTGKVSGTTSASVTFSENAVPTDDLQVDTNNDGTKEEYHWLSMSYILPADETTGYAKTTVGEVSFEFAHNNDSYQPIQLSEGLNNVPVQRNWRTNIVGNLLMGSPVFNIAIDPDFDGDLVSASINGTNYATLAEAINAAQSGQEIKVMSGLTLQNSNALVVDKKITLNLNRENIEANVINTSLIKVINGGELTIKGEGNINVTAPAPAANPIALEAEQGTVVSFISNEGGVVNLDGGTWTMEAPTGTEATFVYNNSTSGAATLNINGGTFTHTQNLFHNYANNTAANPATINLKGGKLNGGGTTAGAIYNQKASESSPANAGIINIIGSIIKNVDINDQFATTVTNNNELAAAISNSDVRTIIINTAGTYDITYSTKNALTIIGTEGVKIQFTGSNALASNYNQYTIHNCEVLRMPGKTWGMIAHGGYGKVGGIYTISNCVFNGVSTQGIYYNERTPGVIYNVVGCTFNGDFGGEGAVTIQNNETTDGSKVYFNVFGCNFANLAEGSPKISYHYAYNVDYLEVNTEDEGNIKCMNK